MKKLLAIVLLITMTFSLCSCGVGEFFAMLGFDTHNYEGERVIKEHSTSSEVGEELSDMVKILTINSTDIPEFKGTKEAVELCRDALLNSMYTRNFGKYAGNPEIIGEAEQLHPDIVFSVLIPASDFENTAYKYFGGKEKITNKSGIMYDYIEDIDAYITAASPVDCTMTVNIHSIEETQNTFRMYFDCSLDSETSDRYFALIIKRSDDSLYFKFVEKR